MSKEFVLHVRNTRLTLAQTSRYDVEPTCRISSYQQGAKWEFRHMGGVKQAYVDYIHAVRD